MHHAKDKKGQQLAVGQRILIPAKIVNISPTPGPFDCKVILEHRIDRQPTEFICNSSQVELHPDEEPAPKPVVVPQPAGVPDSNLGFIQSREETMSPAMKSAEPPPGGWPKEVESIEPEKFETGLEKLKRQQAILLARKPNAQA
jgi:hypothetical protein